ncbi:OmpA family protein [Streptomyces sp. NPDC049555]|uniref:OmpA family protein n=1 Tax=Streptomyces sp. NPDC049555 TaxID=3154930 RepID=UPI00343F1E18
MAVPTHTHARTAVLTAATVLALSAPPAAVPAAAAGPGTAPGTTAPVRIDPTAPGLKLRRGARLAAGRVLDVKSVVETDDGDERRVDTNTDVTFALQAEVLFEKDSSGLGPAAVSRIRTIADEARRQHATTVRVFGFTDDLGPTDHGTALSKERANAVQRELAKDLGSSAVRYEIRGYGEQYPIADNATEEGRRKNRRVEVTFPRGGG